METETFIAGLPLSTAVPALSTAEPAAPATPAALRAELADAIRLRNEVDVKACAAAEIASRAESAKLDATMTVEQLKAGLDAAQRDATERHAEACTTAFRTGEALPPAPALPEANSAALTAALARLNALRLSACELATEANVAEAEAVAAANACSKIIDAILIDEAHELASEAVAAIELHWDAIDRLKGLIMIDEARPGGPRLRGFQEALVQRIDRRRAAVADDPRFAELPVWNDHLDALAADQKRAWQDYARRLASDPSATFDPEDPPQ